MSVLDLAVVGTCASAALMDRTTRIVPMRSPRLAGDPLFCSLPDGEARRASEQKGDVSAGALPGDIPQTASLPALVSPAIRLGRRWKEVF